MSLGVPPGLLPGVALISPGQLDRAARDRLHGFAQLEHLGSLLLIGWRHVNGQQMAQCVDRYVHLAAALALVAVVATA